MTYLLTIKEYYDSAVYSNIKPTIKHEPHGCTRQADNPQYIAQNILNRNFHAEKPNQIWLTDVSEFKWVVTRYRSQSLSQRHPSTSNEYTNCRLCDR